MSVSNFLNRLLGFKTDEEVELEEQVRVLMQANAELSEEVAKLRRLERDLLALANSSMAQNEDEP